MGLIVTKGLGGPAIVTSGYTGAAYNYIKHGTSKRYSVGWKYMGTTDSNPTEYAPYSRTTSGGSAVTPATDTPASATFTNETPNTPVYSGD